MQSLRSGSDRGVRRDAEANSEDVKKCSYCAKPLVGEDAYYFRCRYCGQDFCYEHRFRKTTCARAVHCAGTFPRPARAHITPRRGRLFFEQREKFPETVPRWWGFQINFSKQGRNLAILVVAGLVLGYVFSLSSISTGLSITDYLIQYNASISPGDAQWYPSLLTSDHHRRSGFSGTSWTFFSTRFRSYGWTGYLFRRIPLGSITLSLLSRVWRETFSVC